MIGFERTADYQLVKEIAGHPKIYPFISDDGCPEAEQWTPSEHDSIWYVLVKNDEEVLGLFMLVPQNSICYEIHTALLPKSWGNLASEAARGMSRWTWENTPCRRLITNVPDYNKLALRFARKAGMQEFGVNEASYLKGGKVYDQIMLGMTKPEAA